MVDEHFEEVADYAAQAREFLVKGRGYLTAGDLHQASEKGWGAAAHMAKAVALNQGWGYRNHSQFHAVMNRIRQMTGNPRISDLHGRAELLHVNYYARKRYLDAEAIAEGLDRMADLVELLAPLAGQAGEE